jgi:hypothetical protein
VWEGDWRVRWWKVAVSPGCCRVYLVPCSIKRED